MTQQAEGWRSSSIIKSKKNITQNKCEIREKENDNEPK